MASCIKVLTNPCSVMVTYGQILQSYVKICPVMAIYGQVISQYSRIRPWNAKAIDVRKVNIGNIVGPGTKIAAGTNLRLLPTWYSSNMLLNSKLVVTSVCEPILKPVPNRVG